MAKNKDKMLSDRHAIPKDKTFVSKKVSICFSISCWFHRLTAYGILVPVKTSFLLFPFKLDVAQLSSSKE